MMASRSDAVASRTTMGWLMHAMVAGSVLDGKSGGPCEGARVDLVVLDHVAQRAAADAHHLGRARDVAARAPQRRLDERQLDLVQGDGPGGELHLDVTGGAAAKRRPAPLGAGE